MTDPGDRSRGLPLQAERTYRQVAAVYLLRDDGAALLQHRDMGGSGCRREGTAILAKRSMHARAASFSKRPATLSGNCTCWRSFSTITLRGSRPSGSRSSGPVMTAFRCLSAARDRHWSSCPVHVRWRCEFRSTLWISGTARSRHRVSRPSRGDVEYLLLRVGPRRILLADPLTSVHGKRVGFGNLVRQTQQAFEAAHGLNARLCLLHNGRPLNRALPVLVSPDVATVQASTWQHLVLGALWRVSGPARCGGWGVWRDRIVAGVVRHSVRRVVAQRSRLARRGSGLVNRADRAEKWGAIAVAPVDQVDGRPVAGSLPRCRPREPRAAAQTGARRRTRRASRRAGTSRDA